MEKLEKKIITKINKLNKLIKEIEQKEINAIEWLIRGEILALESILQLIKEK